MKLYPKKVIEIFFFFFFVAYMVMCIQYSFYFIT